MALEIFNKFLPLLRGAQAYLPIASFAISLFSLFVAISVRKGTNNARKSENTKSYLSQYRSSEFQVKLKWVIENLEKYRADNKIPRYSGLTILNKGKAVKLETEDGRAFQILPGDISKSVLIFFNDVSKDIRNGNVDVEMILEELLGSAIRVWNAMTPSLKNREERGYYRIFRIRYSIGSLINCIEYNEDYKIATKIIKKKWRVK